MGYIPRVGRDASFKDEVVVLPNIQKNLEQYLFGIIIIDFLFINITKIRLLWTLVMNYLVFFISFCVLNDYKNDDLPLSGHKTGCSPMIETHLSIILHISGKHKHHTIQCDGLWMQIL